jgi:phosphomannomutase
MDKIKFGPDGWKGIIAKDFTVENVARLALATSLWMTRKYKSPSAIIGFDCRFSGVLFMESVAKILASKGVKIYIAENFVTTPMVSLGVLKLKAQCGIMITGGNSPSEFNGYRLMGENGGPMPDKDLKDIEDLVSTDIEIDLELLNWNYMLEAGAIMYLDLENIYIREIKDHFDLESISASGLKFAFDAMFGSSQNIFRKILPDVHPLHSEMNPSFRGIPPEPVRKNLHELIEFVWRRKNIDCSFAADGAGERIALFDMEANYIDGNMIILLLIHYFAGYLGQKGKVVVSFPASSRVEKLCQAYNLEVIRSKGGFQESVRLIAPEELLLSGEETGFISLGNHLPESDAIWSGITIWHWMAKHKKSLEELCREVTDITGPFSFEKAAIDMNRNSRNRIIEKCTNGNFTSFGRFVVDKYEIFDGCKFFFNSKDSLLIRSSPTEPQIQLFADAENTETAQEILYSGIKVIMEVR